MKAPSSLHSRRWSQQWHALWCGGCRLYDRSTIRGGTWTVGPRPRMRSWSSVLKFAQPSAERGVMAYSANRISRVFNAVQRVEKVMRYVAGGVFVLTGVYHVGIFAGWWWA